MTPELELAQMLSEVGKDKTASALESYSIEELEQVLRQEGMEKKASFEEKISLADRWGRERAHMEKDAFVGGALRAMTNAPAASRMIAGGIGGAALGGAGGAAAAGEGNRGAGFVGGALAGAGAGVAGGAYSRKAVMGLAKNTNTVGKALVNAQAGAQGNAVGLKKALGARGEYLGGQSKNLAEQAAAANPAAKEGLLKQEARAKRHAAKYTSGEANKTLDKLEQRKMRQAGQTPSTPAATTPGAPAAAPAPTPTTTPTATPEAATPVGKPRAPAPVDPKMEAARQQTARLEGIAAQAEQQKQPGLIGRAVSGVKRGLGMEMKPLEEIQAGRSAAAGATRAAGGNPAAQAAAAGPVPAATPAAPPLAAASGTPAAGTPAVQARVPPPVPGPFSSTPPPRPVNQRAMGSVAPENFGPNQQKAVSSLVAQGHSPGEANRLVNQGTLSKDANVDFTKLSIEELEQFLAEPVEKTAAPTFVDFADAAGRLMARSR